MSSEEVVALNLSRRYESRRMLQNERILPVALVTGYLGSGKTTLLQHVLRRKENLRLMIAVNDYAQLNVDGMLMQGRSGHEKVMELSSGSFVCSLSKDFEPKIYELLQDESLIDYLVIEASGVTTPTLAVHSLEKRFGKMTRARLDKVICVIDTESLYQALVASSSSDIDDITTQQLACADVVVLNKLDLVTDDMVARVRSFVRELLGDEVVVVSAQFCDVPISTLLALEESTDVNRVLSHEGVHKFYTPVSGSSSASRLNTRGLSVPATAASYDEYLKQHSLQAVEFSSQRPFLLSAFTRFMTHDYPDGVVRGKGFLWFAEDRVGRYTIQLTSRCRCHVVRESRWPSRPETVLIFVLRAHVDVKAFTAALHALCAPTEPPSPSLSSPSSSLLVSTAADLLAKHELFEIMDDGSGGDSGNVLLFRITPSHRYGMDATHLAHHGVMCSEVNTLYAQALNYAGHMFIACKPYQHVRPRTKHTNEHKQAHHHHHHHNHHHEDVEKQHQGEEGEIVLLWSMEGEADTRVLESIMPTLIAKAEDTITEAMKHVSFCSCGR